MSLRGCANLDPNPDPNPDPNLQRHHTWLTARLWGSKPRLRRLLGCCGGDGCCAAALIRSWVRSPQQAALNLEYLEPTQRETAVKVIGGGPTLTYVDADDDEADDEFFDDAR